MQNHATCVGTRSEKEAWVGGASVVCNCRKGTHVKTKQANGLMNVKSVLNIM